MLNHETGSRSVSTESDPMEVPVQLSRNWKPATVDGMPAVFTGGWVGYAGYDTVRYVYGSKCGAGRRDVVAVGVTGSYVFACSWQAR